MNENRHGATARRKKKIRATVSRRRNANFDLRSRVFVWPCAVKNEGDRNLHLDLRGFTLTVRTPQCDTLFGEKNIEVMQLCTSLSTPQKTDI